MQIIKRTMQIMGIIRKRFARGEQDGLFMYCDGAFPVSP
jgi:hypothetical protein